MLLPFFTLAMSASGRQRAFRNAVIAQALLSGSATVGILYGQSGGLVFFGQALLVINIVQGALLVGWRLTQIPKSQSLEFLLVSPIRPHRVFWGEALTGIGRLGLVSLVNLPVLALLARTGFLDLVDVVVLMVVPFTWGVLTGVGLTMWAYESIPVRRWGERFLLLCIGLYLGIGVLVGEKLQYWLGGLPPEVSQFIRSLVVGFHTFNPFGVLRTWMKAQSSANLRVMIDLELVALGIIAVVLLRSASRLKGHFDDRHYRPAKDARGENRGAIGNRPLSWWAVRRVMEYSGRANLWLAGGFGILYAMYTVAGPAWPSWMGSIVFVMFSRMGGIPALSTALVVLAAVPASFQYGLWDSNAQDRCRRLELLLLTELDGNDYWAASAAAAWRRGRGYFFVAIILWIAGAWAGQLQPIQLAAAMTGGILLWTCYFVLGFHAFSHGMQANGLGSFLTLGVPLLVYVFVRLDWIWVAALLPPGFVYVSAAYPFSWHYIVGPVLMALFTLRLGKIALGTCDRELHNWYELHHGQKLVD